GQNMRQIYRLNRYVDRPKKTRIPGEKFGSRPLGVIQSRTVPNLPGAAFGGDAAPDMQSIVEIGCISSLFVALFKPIRNKVRRLIVTSSQGATGKDIPQRGQRSVQYLLGRIEVGRPANAAAPGCTYHARFLQLLEQPVGIAAVHPESDNTCTALRCGGTEDAHAGQATQGLQQVGCALLQGLLDAALTHLEQHLKTGR